MNNRADRKKQLIAQGALCRAELLLAKQDLQTNLQPRGLARTALQQGLQMTLAAIRSRSVAPAPVSGLHSLLPLLMTGISVLSRRKSLLTSFASVGAAAAIGTGIAMFASRRRQRCKGTHAPTET